MKLTGYALSISKITDLNPIHCETVFIERFRTLNSLTHQQFVNFTQRIEASEKQNPGWLAKFHSDFTVSA